jgi:Tol biopolymer transport system component
VNGDRQISLEGYAHSPLFTRDAKSVTYKVLKGASPYNDSSELWIVDLDSGRREPLLPGFAIAGDQLRNYDISPDGKQIVVAVRDHEGKTRLWLAPMDRRSPPSQIPNVGRLPACIRSYG